MKLLVLAQTPPPLHGQSRAIQSLLDALRSDPRFTVSHVNLPLSRDLADIGRWRPGKFVGVLRACFQVWMLTLRTGRHTLYYVPAPAKRGALYRDWLIMLLCRPLCPALVLHWHAVGLGTWLRSQATAPERWLTRRLLGRADLSIVVADAVRAEAAELSPRRCLVVPNGVPDPAPPGPRVRRPGAPLEVLFVGAGSREKGLCDALEGVALANREGTPCRLTAIGAFVSPAEEQAFHALAHPLGAMVRHLGFVTDEEVHRQFAAADVFCFPSYYPHEGQPAVLLEALAHDLAIITTRWRGIPEGLPAELVGFVEPRHPDQIAQQLRRLAQAPPPPGARRAHYLAHFTRDRHLAALKDALLQAELPLRNPLQRPPHLANASR